MHQKRNQVTKKIPITRKGNKFVVRASSHLKEAVPVVIAVRDMLNLARTTKEVKQMIHEGKLKINGRKVNDYKESIKLFNVFEADKVYELSILPTSRFTFKEHGKKEERLCRVNGKRLVGKGQIQLNLHDGSNILTKDKINVGDSVYLDFSGKIKTHVKLEKGKNVFVFGGKYIGREGKVENIENRKVKIKFDDKEVDLPREKVAVF